MVLWVGVQAIGFIHSALLNNSHGSSNYNGNAHNNGGGGNDVGDGGSDGPEQRYYHGLVHISDWFPTLVNLGQPPLRTFQQWRSRSCAGFAAHTHTPCRGAHARR